MYMYLDETSVTFLIKVCSDSLVLKIVPFQKIAIRNHPPKKKHNWPFNTLEVESAIYILKIAVNSLEYIYFSGP